MMDIRVLRVLLFLAGFVDQKIESMGIRFVADDGEQVSLVEFDHLMHRLHKRL